MTVQILIGDCRDVLKTLADNSVDSVVTDPPYGIGFMGKEWDSFSPEATAARRHSKARKTMETPAGQNGVPGEMASASISYNRSLEGNRLFQAWCQEWAAQVFRVLKPGGHIVVFSGARTYHRMVAGVEDAGFEIRDQLMWIYGSGFPKSLNLKGDHQGMGTALKPAHEPIMLARKPLVGTVAENIAVYGTGTLNIDGCRLPTEDSLGGGRLSGPTVMHDGWDRPWMNDPERRQHYAEDTKRKVEKAETLGRWPANILHDGSDDVLAAFPDAPGQMGDVKYDANERKTQTVYGAMNRGHEPNANSDNDGIVGFKMKPGARRRDSGSAARFFYCAKASRSERDAGLEGLAASSAGEATDRKDGSAGLNSPRAGAGAGRMGGARNTHPTVKPVALMQWLCRLVTPKGGKVLDLFAGTGTTAVAAEREGFDVILIELYPEYADMAERRIRGDSSLFADVSVKNGI